MLIPFFTSFRRRRGGGPVSDDVRADLSDGDLDTVTGGTDHAVKSPRDASTGLATGRRTHRPLD